MPIICPYCSREFKGDKLNARHLSKCNPESSPKVKPCLCGHEATSLTQMKRHRRMCEVWQSRDRKVVANARRKTTSLERYGVEDARRTPEADTKRAATNRERYGAENPFSREASTFEKVQTSLEGKRPVLRGSDCAFAKAEVKEKIQAHWQRGHGVSNPQQVPEIRERTRATNQERYGGELLGSPVSAAKIRDTNKRVYGDEFPQRTEPVKARQRETNQERYGVPWTCMDPEVRRKQLETMESRWGGHFFASDEGKKIVREALKEKFGVEFPGAIEGHWDRLVEVFKERYGVEHPLQLEEFREKQRQTNIERYGWDYFINSRDFVLRCFENADIPIPDELPHHPMKNKDYARKHLERMHGKGPNLLEGRVAAMCDRMMFTGDGQFWKWLPLLGQHKNPDFIVPGPAPKKPFKGVTRVVEVFGNFWHSRMFTGKAPFDHEQELIEAFQDIGIECLVIWESEVKSDPGEVEGRILEFCGSR